MAHKVKKLLPFNLAANGTTNNFHCAGLGPFSIQAVTSSLTGAPTWTLEVSNDGLNFVEFDATTTDMAIDDRIQSDYVVFPWEYLRLNITSNGATGTVVYKIWYDG